jgi:hypothetical protein
LKPTDKILVKEIKMPIVLFTAILASGALFNDYSFVEVAIYAGYGLLMMPTLFAMSVIAK